MTWISTWPQHGRPQYRVHPTEAAAEAHAHHIVRSGTATTAVAYQLALPDERNQP